MSELPEPGRVAYEAFVRVGARWEAVKDKDAWNRAALAVLAAQPLVGERLPPLPEPRNADEVRTIGNTPWFSAKQMREYARAALASAQPAAPKGEALDARRYRWLRSAAAVVRYDHTRGQTDGGDRIELVVPFDGEPMEDSDPFAFGKALDAAIDAAMSLIPPDVAAEKKE